MDTMLEPQSQALRAERRFVLHQAASQAEIREAQRLRYRVFAEEMGARVPGGERGLDCDRFDPYCDHLLVRDTASGRVVGTYRLLDWQHACRAGGFYAASEFDLTRLRPLLPHVLEIGRACVHPEYRGGAVITLLWAGILSRVRRTGQRVVMGAGSIPARDGHAAASACRWLLQHHLGPPEWRVTPHRAFVLEGWQDRPDAAIPPLIKAYLRLGASVGGPPAWDRDFRTADVLLLLPTARIGERYVSRLLRAA